GRAQNGVVQAALENGEVGRGGRPVRLGDGAFLFGGSGHSRIVVGLRLGDVGARARDVVRGLIDRLLRGGVAAGEVGGTVELRLGIGAPRFCPVDLGLEPCDLL